MFIWTEALGCPEILGPSLRSFFAHHNQTLNVVLYEEDLFHNEFGDRVVVHRLPLEESNGLPAASKVKSAYEAGHNGTATLWSALISNQTKPEPMIHLDADNIYLRNILDEIELGLDQGFDIVGFRRAYYRTTAPISELRRLTYRFRGDKVHTLAFGFHPERLAELEDKARMRLIRGGGRSRIFSLISPNLDYFDGAYDYMISKGGKVLFVGEDSGSNRNTRRMSEEPDLQLSETFLRFDAVGSGCVAYKRLSGDRFTGKPASPYETHAIEQFAAYSKLLLGVDIGVDFAISADLAKQIEGLDLDSWKMKTL
jgi:hypothetical protein